MNFSVCLISKNEGKTLPRLLGSLQEFIARGGKVLLLDTGSTDNTIKVAEDFGCEVYAVGEKFIVEISEQEAEAINTMFVIEGEEPLVKSGDRLFDYSSARNYIAQFSPTDMIATPDCDEVYTTLNIDEIEKEINDGADQLEYNFVFSHDEFGNEAIKFRHCKFYNHKKLKWVGIIHEVLQGRATPKFLDESIIKLEHYQNHETNRSGYLRGLALDCYRDPSNDRNSHYLGREMLWTGRVKSAIQELERHISMDKWPAERAQSMIFIGDAYLSLGDKEQAIDYWLDGYRTAPYRREALMRLADFYYKEGKAQEAAAFATAALTVTTSGFYADNQAHYTYYPHEILYWALWQLGDIEGSHRNFLEAWHYQPRNPKYLADAMFHPLPTVSIVIPTLGRPDGLAKALEAIEQLNYPKELLEVIVEEDNFENRMGVPITFKKGMARSTGEYIIYGSNDTLFLQDSVLTAVLHSLYYQKKLVAFNTGTVSFDEGNICEHFLIKKDLIPELGGEIFDTEFNHVGVDNLLWAKAKKLGEATRCDHAHVLHKHFTRGAEWDEIYKLAWDPYKVEHDRALLNKKLNELYGST
jgi:glycosyltransferase involved in cell wall biosynthesis